MDLTLTGSIDGISQLIGDLFLIDIAGLYTLEITSLEILPTFDMSDVEVNSTVEVNDVDLKPTIDKDQIEIK